MNMHSKIAVQITWKNFIRISIKLLKCENHLLLESTILYLCFDKYYLLMFGNKLRAGFQFEIRNLFFFKSLKNVTCITFYLNNTQHTEKIYK